MDGATSSHYKILEKNPQRLARFEQELGWATAVELTNY